MVHRIVPREHGSPRTPDGFPCSPWYNTMHSTWKNRRPTRYRIQVEGIAIRRGRIGTFERYFNSNGSPHDMRFILKLAHKVEAKMIAKYGPERVHLQFLDEDGQWENV